MFPRVWRGAEMNARWAIWTIGIAALALFALLPLRIVLGGSDLGQIGFTARQVAGTIWYGRIGDLHLRSQPLGTFDVSVDPLPLLFGTVSMRFNRLDSPEGPLAGRLIAGLSRGMRSTSGRIAVGDMFAPVPIGALELNDVTVLFRNGECAEASGRVTPILTAPIPGVRLDPSLSGTMECEGERARVELASPSGGERMYFYVQESGDYRARLVVRSRDPAVNAGLAVFGFRPTPEGLSMTVDGRL